MHQEYVLCAVATTVLKLVMKNTCLLLVNVRINDLFLNNFAAMLFVIRVYIVSNHTGNSSIFASQV